MLLVLVQNKRIVYCRRKKSRLLPLQYRRGSQSYILLASFVIWQDAPLSPIQISPFLFIDCTANALGRYFLGNVVFLVLGEALLPGLAY